MIFTNNYSYYFDLAQHKYKLIVLLCLLLSLPTSMMAWDETEYGANVTNELRDQNTPSGWTAVSLPSITITESNTTTVSCLSSTGDNTSVIQAALDNVSSDGGMVIIPAGTWLCGPLTVKSKTVLHLKAGCTLKLLPFKGKMNDVSTGELYYPVTGWTETVKDGKTSYSSTLKNFINNGGNTVDDLIIEGEGETSVIDGQGQPWWELRESIGDYTRPNTIRIEKGSRHLFRNFKVHNSPSQNIVLGRSGNANNITVHDVIIDNPSSEATTASHNTDGFPIWGPYVNIYNCNISTGDDNVVCDSKAHHIHAWNITCGDGHGMSIGSYTSELHDVIYEGITFTNTGSGFRIKTNSDRSGNDQSGTSDNGAVKNIVCRNATMTGCPSPIKITSWYDKDDATPSNCTSSTITKTTPEFCNITFQNITASAVSGKTSWKHNRPIYLYGRPEIYIHDVTFDNVKIGSVLGMFLAYTKNVTFKNGCNITNTADNSKRLTTEYLAYSDNGSTLISANPSKYNGSETATTHAVNFMDGSTIYKTYNICPNSYAYPPAAPTKSGATFKGWATSENGTAVSLSATELAAGGTFYALWEENGSGSGESGSTGTNISLRFTSADGDITSSTTYCNSFSVVGASGKAINIASSSKTIDGVSFSNCAKMGGTGSSDGRYISFPVTGDCAIKVYGCTSSSNNSRSLTIASGSSALGTSLKTDFCTSSSDPVAETYNYIGDATTIYVYSTNSGYNIYGIDVTYASSGGGSSDPETPSSIYPLTATWDFTSTSNYTSGQYSKQNSSEALTVPSSSVTAGDAQNLTVDVTSGKFNTRGTDVQVNQGTKIRVPITSNSDVVTVKTSAGYSSNYTIGGAVMTAQEVAHTATDNEATQGYVVVEAIGSGYLQKISVVQNNQTVTKGPKTVTYYDYNGTTSIGTQTVTEGYSVGSYQYNTCTVPTGYTFGGWFTATGLVFSTSTPVIDDIAVYPYIYKEENGYYMVPAGCGKVLLYTLKNVPSGSKVFLPNGTYNFGTAVLNSVAANISVIGQSQDKVIIRNAPTEEGIGATATLTPGGSDYMQDLSIQCSSESCATPDASRCVTIQDKTTRNVFKNVSLLSGQDTYYSNGAVSQQSYFEDCYITGTVDYICGGGDIVFKNTTFYNLARDNGDVIFAPATNASTKWGYVALDCTVDGASGQNTKFNIGRDWQGSPAATLINTEFKILPTTAAYSKMSKTALVLRFHEYNSHQSDGTVITGHNLDALEGGSSYNSSLYLTESQAATYTLSNIFASGQYDNVDAWNPAALTTQAIVSDVTYANGSMSWTGTAPAYLIEDASGNFVAITTTTSYTGGTAGYTVRAANSKGGFGEAVAAEEEKAANLSFTASVQGGSRPSGSYVNAETHLYNNWGTSGWVAQTYLGFNVTVPSGKQISSATLKFTSKVDGGSAQSYTATAYLLSKTDATNFDENNISLSNAIGTQVDTWTDQRSAYNEVSLTISKDDLNDVITSGTTSKVIFQLGGSSGGATVYGKGSLTDAPTLEVEFEDIPVEQTSENFSMATPSTAPSSISDMTVSGGSISDNNTNNALSFDKNGVKFGSSSCQLKVTLNSAIQVGTKVSITYKNTSSNNTTGLGLFDSNVQNAVINLANNISSGSSGTAEYVFNASNATYIGQNTFVITRNGGSGGLAVSAIEVTIDMPEAITATVASTRTFGSFSSLYNVDFSDANGNDAIQAYTVKYNSGSNSVTLTRHQGVLPAGTGVVLYAPTSTKSQNFNTVAETMATVADNDMVGVPVATYVEKEVNGKYAYGLSADRFKLLSADGTIPAGKAYLRIPLVPTTSGAKELVLRFDDVATGITEATEQCNVLVDGKIYNMQGQQVKIPVPGKVYIINGMKVLFQ